MSQSPGVSARCGDPCKCLVREPETEKDDSQPRVHRSVGVNADLVDKGVVGNRITERKRIFEMRPRQRKPAGSHQVQTGGSVSENEPEPVVALTAHAQQFLVQSQGQVQFAAEYVIAG